MAKKENCDCDFGTMCTPECMAVANREIRRRRAAARKTHGIFPPLHSETLAVHPSQIPEAYKDSVEKGVPTDYDSEGCPIFRSRQHRSKFARAYGYFDADAGYGDPAPNLPKRNRRQEREQNLRRIQELGIMVANTGGSDRTRDIVAKRIQELQRNRRR